MKIYGNDIETFAITDNGRIFLIQSPDLETEYEEIRDLPENAVELHAALLDGFCLPDAIHMIDAAARMGKKGGLSKSTKKADASRENGKKHVRKKGVK